MQPIGKLSKAAGVKVPTIRYYEQIGLLPEPGRSTGNQRLYDVFGVAVEVFPILRIDFVKGLDRVFQAHKFCRCVDAHCWAFLCLLSTSIAVLRSWYVKFMSGGQ